MNTNQNIEQYLKEHPNLSNRKLAKRLKISKQDIIRFRQGLPSLKHVSRLTDYPLLKFFARLIRLPLLRGRLTLLNIFLLAVLVRLIYFKYLQKEPMLTIPLLDAEYYLNWSKQILKEGWLGKKVFFTEPLYAYLLAIFTKLHPSPEKIMLAIQAILGSLLPLIIYKLADRVFNRPVAILSSLLTAVYGPFIFYEQLLLKTSLETFLLPAFVLLLLFILPKKNLLYHLAAGLFLGIITTLKGNSTMLLPGVILFIVLFLDEGWRRKIYISLFFALGFFAIILPITVRNYIVGHDFVPTNYSIGIVLYGGNWWDGDGSILAPPFVRPVPQYEETDMYKMAESFEGKTLKPSQVSSFWTRRAFYEILDNPGRWLYMTGKKMLLLITRTELSDNYDYAFYAKKIPFLKFLPDFWMTASLGFTAIILLIFSRDAKTMLAKPAPLANKYNSARPPWILANEIKLVVGVVLAYALLIIIGTVNSRYRVPLIPFFIILASFSLWYIYKNVKAAQTGKVVLAAVLVIIFLILSSVRLSNFEFMTDANFYNNLGSYHQDRNNTALAHSYFTKALEAKADYPWSYSNLYRIYLQEGEIALAKENLDKSIILRPDDMGMYESLKLFLEIKDKPPAFIKNRLALEKKKSENAAGRYDPYFYDFMRYFKQNKLALAEEKLNQSAQKYGNPENTLLNLAVIKKNNDQIEEAKQILYKIIAKNPDFLPAKYNLANIYLKEKNYREAARLLRDVFDLVPEYGSGNAWYYLAASYLNSNQFDAALPIVTGFIKKYENDPAKKEQVEKFRKLLVPNNPDNNETPAD